MIEKHSTTVIYICKFINQWNKTLQFFIYRTKKRKFSTYHSCQCNFFWEQTINADRHIIQSSFNIAQVYGTRYNKYFTKNSMITGSNRTLTLITVEMVLIT